MASQDTGLPKVHAKMLATKSGIHLVGCQNVGNQYFSLCRFKKFLETFIVLVTNIELLIFKYQPIGS